MAKIDTVRLTLQELDLSGLDTAGPVVRAAFVAAVRDLLAEGPVVPGSIPDQIEIGTVNITVDSGLSPAALGREIATQVVGDLRRGWLAPPE